MNLEHLCKIVINNWNRLDRKNAMKVVREQFELLAWKKNKLKLGAIVFEIKERKFHEVVLWEEIDIKFIRQDTTVDDEQKLENILKRLGWQWDAKNMIAMATVIIGFTSYFIAHLRLLYYRRLPTLVYREEHLDYLIKYGFESTLTSNIETFSVTSKISFWLIDVLTDFCTLFNIIF